MRLSYLCRGCHHECQRACMLDDQDHQGMARHSQSSTNHHLNPETKFIKEEHRTIRCTHFAREYRHRKHGTDSHDQVPLQELPHIVPKRRQCRLNCLGIERRNKRVDQPRKKRRQDGEGRQAGEPERSALDNTTTGHGECRLRRSFAQDEENEGEDQAGRMQRSKKGGRHPCKKQGIEKHEGQVQAGAWPYFSPTP